jgi:hypothetical protein
MTTLTIATPATMVPVVDVEDFLQRCESTLGHINSMAEDDEWHCHLPDGHDGVCLALDGTTW